jgi:type II secretory ATPase GspE/PulE/Tfp pilus assembly ATPase PilB-like protein
MSCRTTGPGAAHSPEQAGSGADFHAPGCPKCRYSGVGGKKYLVDVLPFTPELREILASAQESAVLFSYLNDKGYRGIPEKLDEMLCNGELSPEEYQAALTR